MNQFASSDTKKLKSYESRFHPTPFDFVSLTKADKDCTQDKPFRLTGSNLWCVQDKQALNAARKWRPWPVSDAITVRPLTTAVAATPTDGAGFQENIRRDGWVTTDKRTSSSCSCGTLGQVRWSLDWRCRTNVIMPDSFRRTYTEFCYLKFNAWQL